MARILTGDGRRIYRTSKWLGLNEGSDVKTGEASEMVNWNIGEDGHLRVRPGIKTKRTFTSEIRGMWSGFVNGARVNLVAASGTVWKLTGSSAVSIGSLTDSKTEFFGFNDAVYIMNGSQYKVWDGVSAMENVGGYVPVVAISAPPGGGGFLLERVNLLNGKKRQRFSPDGAAYTFVLAESGIDAVEWVKVNGVIISAGDYGVNLSGGSIQFSTSSRPAAGTNTVEVQWRKGGGNPAAVRNMRFSETFNGLTDTRVFLYGDGSNKAVYSGINEFGEPDATYFPEFNFVDVDSENTPVSSMVKHFDRLLAYKPDGLWAITYGTITLADGSVTAGFFTIPINREIGNEAAGQVRLVNNYPVSAYGRSLYVWETSSVRDERTARKISERIEKTLSEIELSGAVCCDASYRQELYIFCGSKTIVYNYSAGAFYMYELGEVNCAVEAGDMVLLGMKDGRVAELSAENLSDDGTAIEAVWKSGKSGYEREWLRKNMLGLWVVVRGLENTKLEVNWESEDGRESVVKELIWEEDFEIQVKKVKVKLRRFGFGNIVLRVRYGQTEIMAINAEINYSGRIS
jgi:hypothetical protein